MVSNIIVYILPHQSVNKIEIKTDNYWSTTLYSGRGTRHKLHTGAHGALMFKIFIIIIL